MNTHVLLVLLGAAVLLLHETHSLGMSYSRDCMCKKYEARRIPASRLRRVQIFPRGAHCVTEEVLATLVGGEKVCLNPHASWVKRIIRMVLKKQKRKGTRDPNFIVINWEKHGGMRG